MRKDAILSQVFFARIEAIDALGSLAKGEAVEAETLRQISAALDGASIQYGRAATATAYGAFAGLLRIVSTLAEWRQSVLDATEGGDRLLRSALERHRLWVSEYGERPEAKPLLDAAAAVPAITTITDLEALCGSLSGVPLPIGVFAEEGLRIPRQRNLADEVTPQPAELSVAFLKFQLGGQPAADVHHLVPREMHDMEIEVRVSRWPDKATHLTLTPVSAEPRSSYELSEFTFPKPSGKAPYMLVQRGRAILQVAQGLKARPFEFKYAAAFQPASVEQPVAIVGHRTLLVEGIDIRSHPITGYAAMDEKIVTVRDLLRRQGLANAQELTDVLELLSVLGNMAGRAVQDAEFDGIWPEDQFQDYVRKELRRAPRIGSDLEEHPAAAGGITDLSFRGIVIELKSVDHRIRKVEDCQSYVEQTASYAAAKGKRVALLCVLDCSKKDTAPWPAADGLAVLRSAPPAEVTVMTVVVQGNITRPSKLSR
ncbi:hypothetical protein [Methylibium petroleiphilum]|uniref:hypothetical protein n=1 Tax=Methylibium petroleiphilum TaxID=105560 RepID=UPI001AD30DE7|nr:hypothetical protein [Methylibium petroleiphilum]MBN9203068.1 hypothetical protein [Methylibium petroleiphilum]